MQNARRVTWRVILTIALGTLLNPLNSSMIAVALVPLHYEFHVDLGTSTWLVAGFYLTAAVAQPLMGRLADLFGPRRIFLVGLTAAGVVAILAPLSPSFGWLVAARAFQALATSTAYPAGLGLIRAASGGGRVPGRALAMLAVAGSVSAALGPTVGGLVLAFAGWQGIFLINLPVCAAGIVLGWLWLPAPPPPDTAGSGLGRVDLPGMILFAGTLTSLLAGLLSFGSRTSWIMLGAAPLMAALLVVWERRAASPFFDLRLLAANPVLVGVFIQFAAVTLVFYSWFFGLPIWLEEVRGFDAKTAGLLVLPIAGLGVLVTPLAANLVAHRGSRSSLVIGSAFMCVASVLLLTFSPGTPVLALLAAAVVVGIPNGFNNMGLQVALYNSAPDERISWAAGQFQTFRYVGAILASTLLGAIFRQRATTAGLHSVALVLVAISVALVVASLAIQRDSARPDSKLV